MSCGPGLGSYLLPAPSSHCLWTDIVKRRVSSQVMLLSLQVRSHESLGILTSFLSFALISILPFLKKSWCTYAIYPCFCRTRCGIGGVWIPNDYVNAETLGLQLEQESTIFQAFHAYLLPAMGLLGLWTVFIGYRFMPNDSPSLNRKSRQSVSNTYCSSIHGQNFVLHVCFPLTGKKMVFSQTTEVRNANLICC